VKIRKGDQVLIIKGKDRGKKGRVLRGFPKENQVLVEGVNIKKVHKRPRREGEKGQIVEVPAPINIAKTKLICPKCNQPTRVGYRLTERGKHRICKKCGAEI